MDFMNGVTNPKTLEMYDSLINRYGDGFIEGCSMFNGFPEWLIDDNSECPSDVQKALGTRLDDQTCLTVNIPDITGGRYDGYIAYIAVDSEEVILVREYRSKGSFPERYYEGYMTYNSFIAWLDTIPSPHKFFSNPAAIAA